MIRKAAEHHSHLFRTKKGSIIQLVILTIALIVIVPQFKQFASSWHLLTELNISWAVLGVLGMLSTVIFASLVYLILIPSKLPLLRTYMIQLATYFTNRLLPSGLGGIGFNALYLVKQAKLTRTEAAVYATANNIIGFVAFSICIGLSTLFADSKIASDVPLKRILLGLVVAAIVIGLISLFARNIQKKIIDFLGHLLGVLLTIVKHPKRLAFAVITSMGITASYAFVLWVSTKSVGVHISIVDLFIAFVAGNAALTVSPTPGGIGAVEAAITAVIVSAGVTPSLALASVVLYRIISYWLPIIPGYIAFRYATKHGYV